MAIPSKAKWLEETSRNLFRPRSPQLKLVDEAIGQYERSPTPAALGKIKLAFEGWKLAKGAGWHANERNRSFAMTQLEADLMLVQAVRFTPQELQALSYMSQQRKQVIRSLFAGKEVTFKGPTSAKQALQLAVAEVKGKGEEAAQWMRSVGKAPPADGARIVREKLEEMAKGIFKVDTLSSLGDLSGFVLGIIAQCGVSVAPVVGHVKDGYDLLVGWGKVGLALHERHSIGQRAYVIDTGAPAAAFNALRRCLAAEAKLQAGEASIATTSFALKTGLVFVDGGAVSGPVVGALKAVSQVSLKLFALAFEREATERANELIRNGSLDIRLFETYPLLGCYLLTSATLSDIIPIECFGQPGWTDYIATLKKRGYDGLYESAMGLIESSPWEIRGMPKRPVKGGGIGLGGTTVPGLAGDLMGDVFKF